MRSRNHSTFDEIAETALEEEKNERYRSSNANSQGPKCSNCNKLGHIASRCYLKDRKDTRVNQLSVRNENREKNSDITCYNCQGKGHMAKYCRQPKKRLERQGLIKERSGSKSVGETSFDHRKAAADRRSNTLDTLRWTGKSRVFEAEGRYQ